MTKVRLAIFPFVCLLLLGAQTLIAQNQGGWTVTGNMQSARELGATVPLASGALVIGGTNGVMPVGSAEIYGPSTGKWKLTGHMADARMLFPAVVLQNGKVLVEGGSTNSTVLASCFGSPPRQIVERIGALSNVAGVQRRLLDERAILM